MTRVVKSLSAIALAAALIASGTASAATADPNAKAAQGVGVMQCSAVAPASTPDQGRTAFEDMAFAWGQGWMSAVNLFMGSAQVTDLGKWTVDQQKAYVHQFCAEHPTMAYASGIANLYDRMRIDQGLRDFRTIAPIPK